MPNPSLTELVIVMDRSGSMASIKDAMEEGFAQFMREQRKIPDPCNVTFYRFDSVVEKVFEECPLTDVGGMLLEPRGSTSLFDALGTSIVNVGARLAAKPEEKRPGKVVFVVITDGQENSSAEFTRDRLAQLVKQQTEVYNWQFAFLGANIDSFSTGASLGIAAAAIQNFTSTPTGVREMYAATAGAVSNYRSSSSTGAKLNFVPDPLLPDETP